MSLFKFLNSLYQQNIFWLIFIFWYIFYNFLYMVMLRYFNYYLKNYKCEVYYWGELYIQKKTFKNTFLFKGLENYSVISFMFSTIKICYIIYTWIINFLILNNIFSIIKIEYDYAIFNFNFVSNQICNWNIRLGSFEEPFYNILIINNYAKPPLDNVNYLVINWEVINLYLNNHLFLIWILIIIIIIYYSYFDTLRYTFRITLVILYFNNLFINLGSFLSFLSFHKFIMVLLLIFLLLCIKFPFTSFVIYTLSILLFFKNPFLFFFKYYIYLIIIFVLFVLFVFSNDYYYQ